MSTGQPLTVDDVAKRLDRAALRVLRIMMDVRQIDGLWDDVRHSRYLAALAPLAAELQVWEVAAQPLRDVT